MTVEIRSLDMSEYEDLIALWERAGLSHRPAGRDKRDTMAREMERGRCAFLGAYDGPKLIGSIIATEDGRKAASYWKSRIKKDGAPMKKSHAMWKYDHGRKKYAIRTIPRHQRQYY